VEAVARSSSSLEAVGGRQTPSGPMPAGMSALRKGGANARLGAGSVGAGEGSGGANASSGEGGVWAAAGSRAAGAGGGAKDCADAGAGAGCAACGVTGAGVRAPRGPAPGGTGVGMAVRRPAAPGRRHPPRLFRCASSAVGVAGAGVCAATSDGAAAAGVGLDDVSAADGVTGRQPDAGALGCAAAGAGALGCAAARPGRHGVPLEGAAVGGCQPPVWSTSVDADAAGGGCVSWSLAASGAACPLSGVAG